MTTTNNAIGNAKQQAAIVLLLSLLSEKRELVIEHVATLASNGRVDLTITAVDDKGDTVEFPLVTIGKQGGFGMPDIRSYPENGKDSSFAFPGNTALDAVLFGDKHLARQKAGRQKKAAEVVAALATQPEAEAQSNAPAPVDKNETITSDVPVEAKSE